MTQTWFKPWRWIAMSLGVTIPLVAVILVTLFAQPGPLRWDPPEPRVTAVAYHDAMTALRNGEVNLAREKLEALRASDAFNALIHASLGEVYLKDGNLPAAIAATRMAVGVDPNFGEAHYNLACYLTRTGRLEEAIAHLQRAVFAGFDVRSPATDDPDLAPLRTDARLQTYLDGARNIPLRARTATFSIEPPAPTVGMPFDLTVELVLLDHPPEAKSPEMSVEYLGPIEDNILVPLEARTEASVVTRSNRTHHRWTHRFRLYARAPFVGELGPWEIQIDGIRIPSPSPTLVVSPSIIPATPLQEASRELIPAFQPRAFFRRPSGLPTVESDEWRLAVIEKGGAWIAGNVIFSMTSTPETGADEVSIRFGKVSSSAWYDVYDGESGTTAHSPIHTTILAPAPSTAGSPGVAPEGFPGTHVPDVAPEGFPSANSAANSSDIALLDPSTVPDHEGVVDIDPLTIRPPQSARCVHRVLAIPWDSWPQVLEEPATVEVRGQRRTLPIKVIPKEALGSAPPTEGMVEPQP